MQHDYSFHNRVDRVNNISTKNRSISGKSIFEPIGTAEIERLIISADYRKNELEEINRLRKGEAKPSASFAKFFWQTEHFVFQHPNFYTTVRMFSNRNMEEPYNGREKRRTTVLTKPIT